MRVLWIVGIVTLCSAAPLMAQTTPIERGYVTGVAGFTATTDATSGNILGEVGVRVAPNLLVFGSLGQFHNLQPSQAQTAVDSTTALLAVSQGLVVVGTPRVPAWYSMGGVRFEIPVGSRLSPYVMSGIGFARLTPTGTFTYTSGTLPNGGTATAGDDVTSDVVSAGDFTAPAASNAFMFTLGTGVDVPVSEHWAVDVGYRYSRIAADTPLNAQGMTFGVGYRF